MSEETRKVLEMLSNGKVSVQDVTFTHWVDKASADLIKA
jgi:type VI protein secretion system component Hcp